MDFFSCLRQKIIGNKTTKDAFIFLHGSAAKAAYIEQKYNFSLEIMDYDFLIICPENILKDMLTKDKHLLHPYKNRPIYLFTLPEKNVAYDLAVIYKPGIPIESLLEESAKTRDFKENTLMIPFKDRHIIPVIYDFEGGTKNLDNCQIETVEPINTTFGQYETDNSTKNYKLIRVFRLFSCMVQTTQFSKKTNISKELENEIFYISSTFHNYHDLGLLRKQLYKDFFTRKKGLPILALHEKYNFAATIFPNFNSTKEDIKKILEICDKRSEECVIELVDFYSFIFWPYVKSVGSKFGTKTDHYCEIINNLFLSSKIYFYPEEIDYLLSVWNKWLFLIKADKNFLDKILINLLKPKKSTSYSQIVKSFLPIIPKDADKKVLGNEKPKKKEPIIYKNGFQQFIDDLPSARATNNTNDFEMESNVVTNKNVTLTQTKYKNINTFFSVNRFGVMESDEGKDIIDESIEKEVFWYIRKDEQPKKITLSRKPKIRSKEKIINDTQVHQLVNDLVQSSIFEKEEAARHLHQKEIGKYIAYLIKNRTQRDVLNKQTFSKTQELEKVRMKLAKLSEIKVKRFTVFNGLLNMAFQDIEAETNAKKNNFRLFYVLYPIVCIVFFIAMGAYHRAKIAVGQIIFLLYIDLVSFDTRLSAVLQYKNAVNNLRKATFIEAEKVTSNKKYNSIRNLKKDQEKLLEQWRIELRTVQEKRLKNQGRAWYERSEQIQTKGYGTFFRKEYFTEVCALMMAIEIQGAILNHFFGKDLEQPAVFSYPTIFLLFILHYMMTMIVDHKWAKEVIMLEQEANEEMEILLSSNETHTVANSF